MGQLINGKWVDEWYDTKSTGGEFVRKGSQFRHWVTADSSAGPNGQDSFRAEANRYHLIISLACPWAHRTLIFRSLKELQNVIGVTVVDPKMLDHGWEFGKIPGETNPLPKLNYLHELYALANPQYNGRVTVPVLWDMERKTIVNNESSEIIRMLNSEFRNFTDDTADYYPQSLRPEIDAINERIYNTVNNGVYRAGFATSQAAYEKAFDALFASLDWLEDKLNNQRYLVGAQITEADWRLFTTLIRFDSVYYCHFKTNLKRIEEYPNLSNYLRDLYQYPGVADTVNFEQIKIHYYFSQTSVNPTQIVAKGPLIDYGTPHNRGRFDSVENPGVE